jgi:hypothetical protein
LHRYNVVASKECIEKLAAAYKVHKEGAAAAAAAAGGGNKKRKADA